MTDGNFTKSLNAQNKCDFSFEHISLNKTYHKRSRVVYYTIFFNNFLCRSNKNVVLDRVTELNTHVIPGKGNLCLFSLV